jgi:hypothetical protein
MNEITTPTDPLNAWMEYQAKQEQTTPSVTDDNEVKQANKKQVGNIGNTYGAFYVTHEDGRYFWAVEGCWGFDDAWEEITPELYGALIAFEGRNK